MLRLKKLPRMVPHRLHIKSGITYATVLQYMNEPETVASVNLVTLYKIMRALDVDLSELRFLDVFSIDDGS